MSDPLRRWSLVLSALVVFGLPIKARAQQQGQSTPCDGEDHLFAVTGSLPDTATALRRHEMLMVHLPTQASVVIIGDSLVQAWPQPLLDRLSPGGVVLNLGVGRDRIQNVIYRLQDPRLSASHLNPTYTVIWAGTNNLGLSEKSCALKESITALVKKVRELWTGTKIILLGVTPRGTSLTGYLSIRLKANQDMADLSHTYEKVYHVDLDDVFDGKQRKLDELFLPDMLHLREPGYELITAVLAPFDSSGWCDIVFPYEIS